MSDNLSPAVTTSPYPGMPLPEWALCCDGHVIVGTIAVRDDFSIEAQIVLDGVPLYRSRHISRMVAEEELMALRGYWESAGWANAA